VNVDLASKLCEVEIEIKKESEYAKDLKDKELAQIKIEDIEGVDADLKKLMIEKGYSNILSVLKAPVEELKFLLRLDDDGVAELLEILKPKEVEESEDAKEEGT